MNCNNEPISITSSLRHFHTNQTTIILKDITYKSSLNDQIKTVLKRMEWKLHLYKAASELSIRRRSSMTKSYCLDDRF